MRIYFFAAMVLFFVGGCTATRISQKETLFFPQADKGKWWIVNSTMQNKNGKDMHFNLLLSIDKAGSKSYASCFVSVWKESDSVNYTAARTVMLPSIQYKNKFPLRFSFPSPDSLGMEWSLLWKRNGLNLLTELNNKAGSLRRSFTEVKCSFNKQAPFVVSQISSSPEAWATKPVTTHMNINGNIQESAVGKLSVSVFSDKEMLLKRSSENYMHWLNLTLESGKQLSLLFSSNGTATIDAQAVLLWDEEGNIMARPKVRLQKITREKDDKLTKEYPLFFSISLPDINLSFLLQPKRLEQEITANKNSFWMGAVEVKDKQSGKTAGQGNMYVFKQ